MLDMHLAVCYHLNSGMSFTVRSIKRVLLHILYEAPTKIIGVRNYVRHKRLLNVNHPKVAYEDGDSPNISVPPSSP